MKKQTTKQKRNNSPITEKEAVYIILSGFFLLALFANMLLQPKITGYAVHEDVSDAISNINFGNLISDFDFSDFNAATYEDIKRFIDSRKPKPAIADPKNTKGIDVAELIVEKAKKYRINPIVLLSTLQKETSLVRLTTITDNDLAKAMGCGCPDTPDGAGCRAEQAGLKEQMECAALTLRKWYDKGQKLEYPYTLKGVNYESYFMMQKTSCSKGQDHEINIANAATFALYKYTPHTFDYCLATKSGGNYLFYQTWVPFYYAIKGYLPEVTEPENIYKINPSFKVKTDYNLNIFDDTIEKAKQIQQECEKEIDKDSCINKKITQFNDEKTNSLSVWEPECSRGYEKVFYDLVYHFTRAQTSTYDLTQAPACIYEFDMTYSEGIVQAINYELRMRTIGKNTELSVLYPSGIFITETIKDLNVYAIAEKYVFNNKDTLVFEDKFKAETVYDSVFGVRYNKKGEIGGGGFTDRPGNDICFAYGTDCTDEKTDCKACKTQKAYYDLNDNNKESKIYLYKSGNRIAFVSPDRFKKEEYNKLPKCEAPPEMDYAFCVKDKTQSKVIAYEPTLEKTGEFIPVLRFALSFRDNIPPGKVLGLTVGNAEQKEETLEISWKKVIDSEGKDINDLHYYEIYCSEKQTNADAMEISARHKPIGKEKETIHLIYCGNNKIKDLDEKGNIVYYNIAVRAVDLSGNKGPASDTVKGHSIDDLAPGFDAQGIDARDEGIYYLIPTKNEDETDIKDDEPLSIYVYAFETKSNNYCKNLVADEMKKAPQFIYKYPTFTLGNLELRQKAREFKPGNQWTVFINYNQLTALKKGKYYCLAILINDESTSFDLGDTNKARLDSRINKLLRITDTSIEGKATMPAAII